MRRGAAPTPAHGAAAERRLPGPASRIFPVPGGPASSQHSVGLGCELSSSAPGAPFRVCPAALATAQCGFSSARSMRTAAEVVRQGLNFSCLKLYSRTKMTEKSHSPLGFSTDPSPCPSKELGDNLKTRGQFDGHLHAPTTGAVLRSHVLAISSVPSQRPATSDATTSRAGQWEP